MSALVLITSEFVPSAFLEADWLRRLPAMHRNRLLGKRDDRTRHRSLLGTRLLAAGLRRLGYGPNALGSLRCKHGARPALDLPVDVSLSHCDGRIVCALSTRGPVGIDVERVGSLTATDFQVYLNQGERAWAGLSPWRFYSVWTRKEAVAKAAGSRGLRDVANVDTNAQAPGSVLAGRLWHTPEVPVGPDHVAHLALADGQERVTIDCLDPQSLGSIAEPMLGDATYRRAFALLQPASDLKPPRKSIA